MSQRLFVAVSLPPEIRMAIDAWRDQLALPGKLVPAENLHITLRFVGDVDEIGHDRLLAELSEAVTPGAFTIRIEGIGGFPRPSKATVAWAGVRDDRLLKELAEAVDEAVAAAGFDYEDRPFHPHLTLSRIRPPAVLHAAASVSGPGVNVRVDRFVLYASRFESGGVRYEAVEAFSL